MAKEVPMDSITCNKAIRACSRFLERREYQVMDTWNEQPFCGVVAKDPDKRLVFAQVLYRLAADEGLPKESCVDRCELETLATDWLRYYDSGSGETEVRFDVISLVILDENRAFLRHHINAFC